MRHGADQLYDVVNTPLYVPLSGSASRSLDMRWAVGFLLIVAAVLKAIEIYLYPAHALAKHFLGTGWDRALLPLQISGEFGVGLLAIFGLYWRQLRWLVLSIFTCFTGYTLLLALQGATSCGCFGQLEVSPWWTLTIDIFIIVGLLIECRAASQGTDVLSSRAKSSARVKLAGVVCFSLILASGLFLKLVPRPTSTESGIFHAADNLIIVDPENWVGKIFPLVNYVDVDVSQGSWVVLMHRHDCSKCQKALLKYEQLASYTLRDRVAVIEVPPHDESRELMVTGCRVGLLSDAHEWFIETPIEIQLEEGVVVSASTELPALRDLAYIGTLADVAPPLMEDSYGSVLGEFQEE